ncbi:FecR domain-containing protein [Planctomycetota bacterium]
MPDKEIITRMELLLENFLDDSLSSTEQNELADILEHSEEARTSAAQFIRMEGGLVNLGRLGQIEAEDLKDAAKQLKRISSRRAAAVPASSRRRAAKRKSKRMWSVWIAAAACLVIAAGAYLYNIYQMSQISGLIKAELIEMRGNVLIERSGDSIKAQKGMEILSGDNIKTETEGKAVIQYKGEETVISISEESELNLHINQGAKQVDLKTGTINCSVPKQPEEKHMVCITPHAEAEVLGTVFTLSVLEKTTKIDVEQGIVRFKRKNDGKSIQVNQEQFAFAGGGYALKSYPAGTYFADGEIVFQDDFSKSDHRWLVFTGGEEIAKVIERDEKNPYLKPEKQNTPLGLSSVLKLNRKDAGTNLWYSPQVPHPEWLKHHVCEYDVYSSDTSDTTKKKWTHQRNEFIIALFPPGELYEVRRYFVDGTFVGLRKRKVGASRKTGINMKPDCFIDNVVVRRLVPVSGNSGLMPMVSEPSAKDFKEMEFVPPRIIGKGNWTVEPSKKGINVKQTDTEAVDTAVLFGGPLFRKGTISGKVRAVSYSKSAKSVKDPEYAMFGFCWFYPNEKADNVMETTRFNLTSFSEGEWYRFHVSFEIKDSGKGLYVHITWKPLIRVKDGARMIMSASGTDNTSLKLQAKYISGFVGLFTRRGSVEWSELKLRNIE